MSTLLVEKEFKLKELLPMFRNSGYDHRDEGGKIIIRPECEEWTWVTFNVNSGLLDLLGDLTVQNIDADEDDIVVWVKTANYNSFQTGTETFYFFRILHVFRFC